MPQLDQTLLFNQIFWLFLSFIYLYVTFVYYILPSFLKIFKTRKCVFAKNFEQSTKFKDYSHKINREKKNCLFNFMTRIENFSEHIKLLKKEKEISVSFKFTKYILNLLSHKILYINVIKNN